MQTTSLVSLRGEFFVNDEHVKYCKLDIVARSKNRVEEEVAEKVRSWAGSRPVLMCHKWEEEMHGIPGTSHHVYRLDALVIEPFDMKELGIIHRLGNELAMFVGRQFASPEQERTQWH